ncbi:HlyD family efflux transporter periplasmic adaptor subunit [Chitinophaga silvatica]|uniref:HlyD family efflux transporter periplasmic adaptor subunit n=1 Tax=Chitinophaga silvatica TaxID=2282649 RepID=A0A3E1YHL7_9BACT|nr:HlyD family efflux transporter periplasmic adaptor subunit [Chitinophaga silvatica]RFS26882.1 HlyD family efflux transporter periplasmic adaptor subunit [Chitinophaga silvatica]
MDEHEKIELRSQEVQEIIGHIPHWVIRYGITSIFFVILSLLLMACIIKYPDIVYSRVTLTTFPPPISIIARSAGEIKLLVLDNDRVKKGQVLGYLKNTTDLEAVQYLSMKLEQLNLGSNQTDSILNSDYFDKNLRLGELQVYYNSLLKSIEDIKAFSRFQIDSIQIASLNNQIVSLHKINEKINIKKQIYLNDESITRRKFLLDSMLVNEKVFASLELDNSKRILFQSQLALEEINSSLINNNIQAEQLSNQIKQVTNSNFQLKSALHISLQNSLKQLESILSEWKQKYLLISQYNGTATFANLWTDNQFVNNNQEIMKIVPDVGPENIMVQAMVLISGSGKLEIGQQVNIKVDNYPYNEFGMLVGKIKSISLVPINNVYTVYVVLSDGLLTTQNKHLEFKQEMQGNAEIITRDMRLIERIFNNIRSLIDTASR